MQQLHSEFPYIGGKFYFLFYQCNGDLLLGDGGEAVGGGGVQWRPGVHIRLHTLNIFNSVLHIYLHLK
jgi:hypothetical protein